MYIVRMNRLLKCFCAFLCLSTPVFADGEAAGDFDYYVLALSWTPSWCEIEGDAKDSSQCDADLGYGFTLHGLWPQYDYGWPSYCRTGVRDPSRKQTASMQDIMVSDGLAWYEWKKHGRCSGLSAEEYFAAARKAYDSVVRPEVFRRLPRTLRLPPDVIEDAFLESNPHLWDDALTVTCKADRIQEIRVCLSKDLEPRECGADVVRDCSLPVINMSPMR